MKAIHYGSHVYTVYEMVATRLAQVVDGFASIDRTELVPIAAYQDERDITVQILIGRSIPIAISDTWLPDHREPPKHTEQAIAYLDGLIHDIEIEEEKRYVDES